MPARPPLLILRPAPGDAATAALAKAAGWAATTAPLSAIGPTAWDAPDPADFDALILTSANALRHGGAGLDGFRHLPAHVVGRATAAVAAAAGFTIASIGRGGAAAAYDLALAAGHRRLFRPAGADHIPLPAAVTTRIVYAARPLPLSPAATALLAAGPTIILLHSAATAGHLRAEMAAAGLPRAAHAIAALAPAIATAAGDGWRAVAAAAAADDDALLLAAGRVATLAA